MTSRTGNAAPNRAGSGQRGRLAPRVLRQLAKQHEVCIDESMFRRRLRLGQALWREAQGFAIGEHEGSPLGSRLKMPDAELQLWNFLTPEIGAYVRAEYAANKGAGRSARKVYLYPRLFNDLLSSQPLCFNLFGPLARDLALATDVARRVWPHRVERVTAVRFEHSPGRQDIRYLGNGTAADALMEHTVPGGGRGIIAIETKYHENLRVKRAEPKPRYQQVVEESRAFMSARLPPEFDKPPLQQILLDHLLVLATRKTDGLRSALSVLVFPRENEPCTDAARRYHEAIDPRAAPTFEVRMLEEICAEIAAVAPGGWIAAFAHRYLDQSRVDLAPALSTASV
jgi:hypothetical protein